MKKLSFFDTFCLVSALALLFAIGFHLGKDDDSYRKINFEIVISPEKVSGTPNDDNITLVDGKYECKVVEFGKNRIVILCDGYYSDAGFLLAGAKYMSVNQPIKASQTWGYYDGRILDIYEVKNHKCNTTSDIQK